MKPIDKQTLHQLEEKARAIGHAIGDSIKQDGRKMGFALMLFSFDGPEMTWISNAQRDDMIKCLDEFRQRLIDNTADELSRPKGHG